MQKQDLHVGMLVSFGRSNGEHTVGKVVKVNREKVKVQQLENRGVHKAYPVGTLWSVPSNLVNLPNIPQALLDMVVIPSSITTVLEEQSIESTTPPVPSVPVQAPAKVLRLEVTPVEPRPVIEDPFSGFKFEGAPGETFLDFGHRLEDLLRTFEVSRKAA